jgi:hydroxymethylpyrimidine/phosphomethylpyrimidine kinase
MKIALTLAGSDSGGGAGIQADLKTFEAHGVFGTTVLTALTAQNTLGVTSVHFPPAAFVAAQFNALLQDLPPAAAKVGMAGTAEGIATLEQILQQCTFPLVVDPVMLATSGASLLEPEAENALRALLLPLATLITPNVPEAERLTGMSIETQDDMPQAAQVLKERYPQAAILLKGGHLPYHPAEAPDETWVRDILLTDEGYLPLDMPLVPTLNTHGTGCTLSAAITANLALGHNLPQSVVKARQYVQLALQYAPDLGAGNGPLCHNFRGHW